MRGMLLLAAIVAALPAAAQMQAARVEGTCDLTLSASQVGLQTNAAAIVATPVYDIFFVPVSR